VNYLRNCWYAAAWSAEVGSALLSRCLLDQPVVLWRDTGSGVHAIGGRCPHRFAPLGQGKLVNGRIQCPYHGLQFDAAGTCVVNPHGDGAIPREARVRAYPAAERHRLVWLWFGELGREDPALIPDLSFIDEPGTAAMSETVYGHGNYQLFSDNILDLGHAEFLHPGFGAPVFTKGKRETRLVGDSVQCTIFHPNDVQSPIVSQLLEITNKRVDYWGEITWTAPATLVFTSYYAEPGMPRDTARRLPSFHVFTPETDRTTHYFWAGTRDFRVDDAALTEQIQRATGAVFRDEDDRMIAAQQELMGTSDLFSLRPVILPGDSGAVLARRLLEKKIRIEAAASDASPR
jgi:phenylpropionate dioxygenase-like ring-hydroxylating dioxygenase large terminal subunit